MVLQMHHFFAPLEFTENYKILEREHGNTVSKHAWILLVT